MNEFLKSQAKTNGTIIANNFSTDELDRFFKSDYRWADNRTKQFRHRTVKKKLLYVLPIFSYDPEKHPNIYHPVDYPNSKSEMFLLKSNEFSFINHDSVLKLNDIRTVSVNHILYQQNGVISPSSDTYKQIEQLVLQKYFPTFFYDYKQLQQKNTSLEETQKALAPENEELKKQIESLQERLANNQEKLVTLLAKQR